MVWAVAVAALSCTGRQHDSASPGADTADPGGDTPDTPDGYPSPFVAGKYKVGALRVLSPGEGLDLDDDGAIDNNLPGALALVDVALSSLDLSLESVNSTLADAVTSQWIVLLIDARHGYPILQIDYLAGEVQGGGVTVSSSTFNASGVPKSRLHGGFSSPHDFHVGPGYAEIPFVMMAGDPPLTIPLEVARAEGELEASRTEGILAGVIPADRLVSDFIDPMIPPEGVDTDGDGVIDLSKQAILDVAASFAENENVADVDLGRGRRGVSAAFGYAAYPGGW